ncbi:hypothetical protein TYRP_019852 [Tyrophagus putrescentiae]|nr:hypothetical protein TYRP_019852 [Tyrophagus putrescentiae]
MTKKGAQTFCNWLKLKICSRQASSDAVVVGVGVGGVGKGKKTTEKEKAPRERCYREISYAALVVGGGAYVLYRDWHSDSKTGKISLFKNSTHSSSNSSSQSPQSDNKSQFICKKKTFKSLNFGIAENNNNDGVD